MKPALAHHLIHTFLPSNGKMLDPFSGVGTIPYEAALNGIKTYGFEISPAAFIISSAKLGENNDTECYQIIEKLEDYIHSEEPTSEEIELSKRINFNGELSDYFHPTTLREILIARRYFQKKKPESGSEYLVLSSLLHILHGNRPYALSRRSNPITPYKPSGPMEYRALIPRLHKKV